MSSNMRHSVDNAKHKDGTPADALIDLLHTVMHQFRSRQFQVLRDGPHDLTRMESRVLGFFARRPGATQSELVLHSGRDKAQLARLIKSLRERGLLIGDADENDRRNIRLRLSDAGQTVQHALRQRARRLSAQAVAGLSVAEHRRLVALLERVQRNLESPG